jgi:formylmethanofuran dehydrogenase subunit B
VLEVVNFMTPIVSVNCYFVVCSSKDCDTLQLSVDDNEEKVMQVCQFFKGKVKFVYSGTSIYRFTRRRRKKL